MQPQNSPIGQKNIAKFGNLLWGKNQFCDVKQKLEIRHLATGTYRKICHLMAWKNHEMCQSVVEKKSQNFAVGHGKNHEICHLFHAKNHEIISRLQEKNVKFFGWLGKKKTTRNLSICVKRKKN